jgi:hypothetical protein
MRPRENPTVLAIANEAIELEYRAGVPRGAEALVDQVGSRRLLEAVRDHFTRRLHRSSFDFEATSGLKLVIAALQRAPWTNVSLPQ